MKRLLAVLCIVMMAGCAQVKDAASDAVTTVTNPPDQIMNMVKDILFWVVQIVANFFADVAGKFGF